MNSWQFIPAAPKKDQGIISCNFTPQHLIPLTVLLVLSIITVPGFGSWDLEFKNELYFHLGQDDSLSFEGTTLSLSSQYVTGEIEDSPSRMATILYWPYTRLAENGSAWRGKLSLPHRLQNQSSEKVGDQQLLLDTYHAQDFGEDYSIGTWGGSSQMLFEGDSNRALEYWLCNLMVNYSGFSYKGTFLLGKRPRTEQYQSGLELALSGTKFSGIAVTIENWFGMQENPLELAGFESATTSGSGYLLTGKGYQGTKAILKNLKIGSLKFANETKISGEGGFEYNRSTFEIDSTNLPLELETSVLFQPKSKDVSLSPGLNTEWGCVEMKVELEDSGNNTRFFSPVGLKLVESDLGPLTMNGIAALQGGLYKRKDEDHMDLHALDYRFDLPQQLEDLSESQVTKNFDLSEMGSQPADFSPYLETNYEMIFSFDGGSADSSFAIDLYFGEGNEANFFDFSLLTGTFQHDLSENLEVGGGLEIDPQNGINAFRASTAVNF
ncbi:MAG: hypothetical protein ACLFN4_05025 [Candidatus Acetothermia bacterium]